MEKAKELSKKSARKKTHPKPSKYLKMPVSALCVIKKWRISASVDTKRQSGRPTKRASKSASAVRKIGQDIKKNCYATSAEIQI